MDIGVLVKASLDVNMIRVDSEGRILLDAIPLAISEYDRNAITEAVRIRDETGGGKVVAFSVLTWGPASKRAKEIENVMREALALGADEAHAIVDDSIIPGDTISTAKVLAKLICKMGKFDLVLSGEASQDMMSSQLPVRLARELNYSVATFARKIELLDGKIRVTRDLEDYLQVVNISLPAVISVTGEINRPKLPTLLQIRRAFRKPYNSYTLSQLGVESIEIKLPYKEINLVTISRKNVILEGDKLEDIADQLIERLIEEGVIKV